MTAVEIKSIGEDDRDRSDGDPEQEVAPPARGPAAMPLVGSFGVVPFDELLELLARRRATGRLHVRVGANDATVWLREGKAVDTHFHGGAMHHGSEWRGLLETLCCEALRNERGNFEFQPGSDTTSTDEPGVRLEDALRAGRRRVEDWREIEALIPSYDAVPRLGHELATDSVTLDRDRWRVVATIDGRRSVSSLARRAGLDLLAYGRLLKPLVECGAIAFGPAPTEAAPDAATVTIGSRERAVPARSTVPASDGDGSADGTAQRVSSIRPAARARPAPLPSKS